MNSPVRARNALFGAVVEVSYPWTLRDAGDEAPNPLGEDSLLRGYPATPRGQRRFMSDIVRMTLAAGPRALNIRTELACG